MRNGSSVSERNAERCLPEPSGRLPNEILRGRMPAAKYTFLTRVDEAALSTALREKFPTIRFYTGVRYPEPHWRYFDDIGSADIRIVRMVVPPPGWEPVFEPGRGLINAPDEMMFLDRSQKTFENRDEWSRFQNGTFQVGVTAIMTNAQISLANKVWRLLSKIGTYRLQFCYQDVWKELPGKRYLAGHDAVRWALEDERRTFYSAGDLRPLR